MAGEVRLKMAAGAAQLLATRGLQATSFSGVLELTGAPRGSIYHHFPEGKDQLVAAALDVAGGRVHVALEQMAGAAADAITEQFLGLWRSLLSHFQMKVGCAVVAVTIATDSPELLDRTATVFRDWREQLTGLFAQGGLAQRDAARWAATLIAASEGAVVMARAEQSIIPFDLVAEQLMEQVRRLMETPSST